MIDIDHFKLVNDTHGHEAGDQVINRLGRALQEGTRGIDLAARIGGEEFAVILTETDLNGGVEVAERLRLAIKAIEVQDLGVVTASFGVAECPSAADNARELLAKADSALYEAKRLGRDRVSVMPLSSNSKMAGSVQR
jgi:diguanylate cyclase (GGDEF)-like protein